MTLKESYRYANYLDELLFQARSYLGNKSYITTTEIRHLRSTGDPNAENYNEIKPKNIDVDFTPNQVLDFAIKVLSERDKLSNAISEAKKNCKINIDASISMNKKKQDFIRTLEIMEFTKPCETKGSAIGYKLDVDGKQISYRYETNEVTSIEFNRNDVKGLIKKLKKETDAISEALDRAELDTPVDFNPIWDTTDKFEDAVLM